jgi:hypothetical protein
MVAGRMNANKILADPEKLRVSQIADITANFTQNFCGYFGEMLLRLCQEMVAGVCFSGSVGQ